MHSTFSCPLVSLMYSLCTAAMGTTQASTSLRLYHRWMSLPAPAA